jgi:murein L,D-transpeptidase YcbB/YkuD
LALYGTDEQKMQLRYNSGFQQLVRFLKLLSNQELVEKDAEKIMEQNAGQIEQHADEIVVIDNEKKGKVLEEINQRTTEFLKKQQEEKIKSPSFEQVLFKQIDPNTQQAYTIREGQKGASVGKIQQMLEKLGYGDTLKGYSSEEDVKNKAIDYDFGPNTYDAVGLFQKYNNMKFTGIVDSETLKALQIKTKEIESKNEKKDIN